jgi:hypothetical protein
MRYRLRTLMIVLALGPPIIAIIYWPVKDYVDRQRASRQLREIGLSVRYQSAYGTDFLPPGARWRYPPGDMDDGAMTMTPIDSGRSDNRPD